MKHLASSVLSFLCRPRAIVAITLLGFFIRLAHGVFARGDAMYTLIDEVDAWVWSWNVLYYSHATFGTFLPGPWQNLLGFALLKVGGAWGFTFFWLVIGTLQIPLTAWMLRKVASPATAAAGALALAILPFPVHYTASFWNPHFIIPLVTLLLGLLFHLAEHPGSQWIALFLLVYALMPFFHFISAFTVPGTLVALWILRVRFNTGWTALGFLGAGALYLPFAWMDAQHAFFITRGWFQFAGGGESRIETLKALTNPLVVLVAEPSRFWGYDFQNYLAIARRWFGHEGVLWILILPSALIALGGLWHAAKGIRGGWSSPKIRVLFWWVLLPTLLFMLTRRPHDERYAVMFWPLLFGASGLALVRSLEGAGSPSRLRRYGALLFPAFILGTLTVTAVLIAQARHPNLGNHVRLPSSLTYMEDLESLITRGSGRRWSTEPVTWPRPVRSQKSTHSLVPPGPGVPVPPALFIDTSTLDHGMEAGILNRNLTQFKTMVNFRGYWRVVDLPQQAQVEALLLAPSLPCPPGWRIVGSLPNAQVALKGSIGKP